MSQGAVIEVIPIYRKTSRGKSVFLELPTGRVELSKAWWRSCPNSCCAHLPGIFPTCQEFCQPLRKSVGSLSRELLVVEHCSTCISCRKSGSSFRKRLVVSPNCRHKDMIHLKQIQRSCCSQEDTGTKKSTDQQAYDLSIGPSRRSPWMRFRIQWAETLKEDCTSSKCLSTQPKARKSELNDGWLQAETTRRQPKRRLSDFTWGQKMDQHSSGNDSRTGQLVSKNGFLADKNETSNCVVKSGSKRMLFADDSWGKVGKNQDKMDYGCYDYSRLHRVLPLGQPSGSSGDEEFDDDHYDDDDDDDDSLFEPSRPQRINGTTAQRQLLFSAHCDSQEASGNHFFRDNDVMEEAINSSQDSPLNESLVIPNSRKVFPQGKQLLTAAKVCAESYGVVDKKDTQKRQKMHRFTRTLLSKEETVPANESRLQQNVLTSRQAANETTKGGDCVHEGSEEECCNNEREPGNNTQQPCLSYLSLPVQDSESYCSQDELTSRLSTAAESTQIWGAPQNSATNSKNNCVASKGPLLPSVQRACDLKNAEWRALQRNEFLRDATSTGSFRCALIDFIVFRNQEGDQFARPLWLPPLLDDETLVYRDNR